MPTYFQRPENALKRANGELRENHPFDVNATRGRHVRSCQYVSFQLLILLISLIFFTIRLINSSRGPTTTVTVRCVSHGIRYSPIQAER